MGDSPAKVGEPQIRKNGGSVRPAQSGRKVGPGLLPALTQKRIWDAEFQRDDQTWILSIEVDERPCTVIDPQGVPTQIFLDAGVYKLIFPSGSASPLRSLVIDPDPGTGRP